MAAARMSAKTRRSRSWASGAGLTRSVTVPNSSLRACVALLLLALSRAFNVLRACLSVVQHSPAQALAGTR